jgi:hypothetical protein
MNNNLRLITTEKVCYRTENEQIDELGLRKECN